jgi:hypothetical protein
MRHVYLFRNPFVRFSDTWRTYSSGGLEWGRTAPRLRAIYSSVTRFQETPFVYWENQSLFSIFNNVLMFSTPNLAKIMYFLFRNIFACCTFQKI